MYGLLVLAGLRASTISLPSGPADETQIGHQTSALQGATDAGPWAVGLANERFRSVCSGVLLAPNLVLTTRHCLDLDTRAATSCATPLPSTTEANAIAVTSCADISQLGGSPTCVWQRAIELIRPAQNTLCGADIALAVLSTPMGDSTLRLATPQLRPWTRIQFPTFSIFGFGATDATQDDWGRRRRLDGMDLTCLGTTPNCGSFVFGAELDAREFVSQSKGVCVGDSGAPATVFDATNTAHVLGIASRGGASHNDCVGSIYTRLDAWNGWLAEGARHAASLGAYAAPVWASQGLGEGAPCEWDGMCTSNTCERSGAEQRCVKASCSHEPCVPDTAGAHACAVSRTSTRDANALVSIVLLLCGLSVTRLATRKPRHR